MYPTFPKGKSEELTQQVQEIVAKPQMRTFPGGFTLLNKSFFKYTLQRFDIVSFSNDATRQIQKNEGLTSDSNGFVKRVIGLPGDLLEIRSGFIWLNGEMLQEPYTAEPKSTFGGTFAPDCKQITIPEDQVFVLGDNRKASNDSRYDLGFVKISDISHVLAFKDQDNYSALWRDTSADFSLTDSAALDSNEYIDQLNRIREKEGLKPLKYNAKLEQSASIRAKAMLNSNDLSFEATRSGITMEQAMNKVGYTNVVWGEAPTLGYYSATELLDNYAQFGTWKNFLLDARFQETGVSAVVGEMNGCPVQIVVQHVAGYVSPNYTKEDLDSWNTAVQQLTSLIDNWSSSRSFGEQYQRNKDSYEKMISIIAERLSIAKNIQDKIEKKQWLSDKDKQSLDRYKELAQEQETLATFLNSQARSANE